MSYTYNLKASTLMFECEYCDKKFYRAAEWKQHLVVHNTIPCAHCDKKFPTEKKLYWHLFTDHF